jgi:hypothetical protein
LKIGSPPNQGNFGSLDINDPNPNAPNGGANLYKWNITNCNSRVIAPGDTLQTESGGAAGPTGTGIMDYCDSHGDFTGTNWQSGGDCLNSQGTLGITTKAALWSQAADKGNGKYDVIVRQIVSFVLERLSATAEVTGYFLPIKTGGAVTFTPTTTQRPILVPDGSN